MVTREEMRFLRWLARVEWSGAGALLEVGPWLGGSTWCLATGLTERAIAPARNRSLHVVDSFIWRPFMNDRAPFSLKAGESFQPQFEEYLRPFDEHIQVHRRQLPDDESADLTHPEPVRDETADVPLFEVAAIGQPVEVAFVDGAKSWRGFDYLCRQLEGGALAGTVTLVLQDFKCAATYWVPMYVGMLAQNAPSAVHLLYWLEHNTVAFGIDTAALADSLPRSIAEVPVPRGLGAIDVASELLRADGDGSGAVTVQLAKVYFLGRKGDWERASYELDQVQRGSARLVPRHQLLTVRQWLEDQTGEAPPLGWKGRTTMARTRAAALVQRLKTRHLTSTHQ